MLIYKKIIMEAYSDETKDEVESLKAIYPDEVHVIE